MTLTKVKLAGLILILLINGCTKKDELTLPVRIHLNFYGTTFDTRWFNYSEIKYFKMTEGWIGIHRIQFEGKRETGGDVFFETDPEINFPPFQITGQFDPISDFDIPQGTYITFKWDFYLKKIADDELYDDYDTASLNPGIIIKCYYNHQWLSGEDYEKIDSARVYQIILIVPDTEMFSNLKSNIVLSEKRDYVVNITFDVKNAFKSINTTLFEEAEISGDWLNQKIIISTEKNKYLYDYLLDQLKLSFNIHVY